MEVPLVWDERGEKQENVSVERRVHTFSGHDCGW